MGVGSGNGYSRARRTAMKRRFPYVRDIIRALGDPGGFFSVAASPEPWLARGDVDVVFLGERGNLLWPAVTHERMITTPMGNDPDAPRL